MSKTKRTFKGFGLVIVFTTITLTAVQWFSILFQAPPIRWPAGRGQEQYEWEPPRVESRVGYVLNGHNFREDLLRMAGNAVVEQQAALAWLRLWTEILNR